MELNVMEGYYGAEIPREVEQLSLQVEALHQRAIGSS